MNTALFAAASAVALNAAQGEGGRRGREEGSGASTLADALGCTRSHMSMILHGTRKLGRKLAARMKEAGIAWPIAQGNGAKGGAK